MPRIGRSECCKGEMQLSKALMFLVFPFGEPAGPLGLAV
jgi:hypothetical protein